MTNDALRTILPIALPLTEIVRIGRALSFEW